MAHEHTCTFYMQPFYVQEKILENLPPGRPEWERQVEGLKVMHSGSSLPILVLNPLISDIGI